MTPPDKTAPTPRGESLADYAQPGNLHVAQQIDPRYLKQSGSLYQAEDASPVAVARRAIAELRGNRERAVERIARKQAEVEQAKADLKDIDDSLRDLGQVPVPRAPRVKKGEVAK